MPRFPPAKPATSALHSSSAAIARQSSQICRRNAVGATGRHYFAASWRSLSLIFPERCSHSRIASGLGILRPDS